MQSCATGRTSLPRNVASFKPARRNGYIEVFGLCGAGKTTILDRLAPAFERSGHGVSVARPIDPGGMATIREGLLIGLKAAIRDTRTLAPFLVSKEGMGLCLKLGLRLASMKQRRISRGTLLIDSGVLQPLVSHVVELNIRGLDFPALPVISVLPFPAAVLYVRTRPEIAFDRYVQRQREIKGNLTLDGLRERFDDGFQLCEWLYRLCTEAKIPALTIDTEKQATSDQIDEIAEHMRSYVDPQ